MGTLFGVKYCRQTTPTTFDSCAGSLIYEAMSAGVPSIISGAGRGFDPQPTEEDVSAHVDAASGTLSLISYIDVANASMWFHGGCGYTAGAGELFLFLAGRVDKSKRVLARVKLDTATVDHVKSSKGQSSCPGCPG